MTKDEWWRRVKADDHDKQTLRCPWCYKFWGPHYNENCFDNTRPMRNPSGPPSPEVLALIVAEILFDNYDRGDDHYDLLNSQPI